VERLRYVIAFTPDIETMKAFYRDRIGLPVSADSPFFASFATGSDSPSLGLVAVRPEQPREIELCFEVQDIEAEVEALRGRGVRFLDEIRNQEFGRVIHTRDPEGNLISFLQPAGGTDRDRPFATAGGAAVAVATEVRLTTAIVHCRDVTAARSFYRDRLGLHMRPDSPWWGEFDLGPAHLALEPRTDGRDREGAPRRSVTIGFVVDDLIAWADEARARGVHFTTVPVDEGRGPVADALDPEGYELTFREPDRPRSVEEELAEKFEDDATPHLVAIRKTVRKGVRAVSRVAVRPEYKTAERKKKATPGATRTKPKSATKAVRSAHGAGPVGSRVKPKRATDPKRARNRPAIGRLKKAERRTLTSHKRAVASASKGKPVKRAVAKRGRKR
jgi:catechol 2,3-dioxygenase-like lactoylglutathione lyase family enzyme